MMEAQQLEISVATVITKTIHPGTLTGDDYNTFAAAIAAADVRGSQNVPVK